MATWKVAPALAAGCAAILKPSELASVYVLELDYGGSLIFGMADGYEKCEFIVF